MNRTAELRLLHETYESHLTSERCRTLTLIGSAGLGKSRLIAEFLREHPHAVVLRTRCPAYGEGSALQPLMDVVGQAAGSTPEDDPARTVERIRELLGEHPEGSLAADGVARALGLASGTTTQEETAWSIRTCLETLAHRSPLVLAFDDVQWAAPALLDVLEHLAEWARGAPILLLCLARPELLNLLPTWGRTPGAVTVQLEPLGAAPSRELARHLLTSPAPAVEDTIADVADGNPFFLEEIVMMLEEEGAITSDATPDDLSQIAIPPTISALLAARIDRLDPSARQVLERAAVLGLAFDRAHLEAILSEADAIDVGATLGELAQRDFVVADPEAPGDGYRFRHALTREAAYDAIPKSLRVRLHTAAAELLADEPEGEARDEQMGYHLEQAHHAVRDLGETDAGTQPLAERAGAHLAAAGRAAAGRGDVRAAAGLFERAAALLPRAHAERPGVLVDLHDALLFAGEIERSRRPRSPRYWRRSRPDDDSVVAERARLQQTMLRFLLDPGATPADVLRRDVERSVHRFEEAGDEASLAAALADLATIHWFKGDAEAMLEAAQLALAHARASGSRRSAAEAAPLIAYALHKGRVPLDEALERLDETRAQLDDDLLARTLLLLDEAMMLAAVGRQDDAKAATDRARYTFEDLGQRRWLEIVESRPRGDREARRPARAGGGAAPIGPHVLPRPGRREQRPPGRRDPRGRALRHGSIRGGRRPRGGGRARGGGGRPRGAGRVEIRARAYPDRGGRSVERRVAGGGGGGDRRLDRLRAPAGRSGARARGSSARSRSHRRRRQGARNRSRTVRSQARARGRGEDPRAPRRG